MSDDKAVGMFTATDGRSVEIRDVWDYNLEEEMDNIRQIIEEYPYIAMVAKDFHFHSLIIF